MTTEEKIIALIADRTQIAERDIRHDMSFDDLGLDSLDIVELLMDVEDAFDLDIPDEYASVWKCPSDIINHLKTHNV